MVYKLLRPIRPTRRRILSVDRAYLAKGAVAAVICLLDRVQRAPGRLPPIRPNRCEATIFRRYFLPSRGARR